MSLFALAGMVLMGAIIGCFVLVVVHVLMSHLAGNG